MLEKIQHLNLIREDIGEESFRINLATIITKYHADRLNSRGIKRNRKSILNHVNFILSSMNTKEVSYGFIRRFY